MTTVSDFGAPLDPDATRTLGRRSPWFAAVYLFFLVDPIIAGWQMHDRLRGLAGIATTVAFGTCYMLVWLRARRERARLVEHPPYRVGIPWLATLVVLGALMVLLLGEPGIASSVYIAVVAVIVLPFRYAAPVAGLITVTVIALGALPGWESQTGTAFGVVAATVAVFGLLQVFNRNMELVKAHAENARLAVDNERSRFARDLHDILGHSLTVITVKAELAQRLFEVDLDRARTEVADLERLSRGALADVRRAVEGYRGLTLPGELVRARAALAAAEIEPRLPNSTDDVPEELRELFAWTVREGVTNVIRHSRARTCEVHLTTTSAEVRDDGSGPVDSGSPGSGLAGLRERASAVGATVAFRPLCPGHSLVVERPAAERA